MSQTGGEWELVSIEKYNGASGGYVRMRFQQGDKRLRIDVNGPGWSEPYNFFVSNVDQSITKETAVVRYGADKLLEVYEPIARIML